MSLAARLREARESIGKTQRDMAKLAGVSNRVWQSYEAGKVTPGGKIFETLVDLGLNANWLLTGKGEMKYINVNSFKHKRFLGAIDQGVFSLTHKAILDYQNETGRLFKHDVIGRLLSLIAFFIVSPQEGRWKTESEIRRVLELVIDCAEGYLIFRDARLGVDVNIALLSFLEDLEGLYAETTETAKNQKP